MKMPLLSDSEFLSSPSAPKHNTFPLHNKSLPPRPGLPGPPRHGDRYEEIMGKYWFWCMLHVVSGGEPQGPAVGQVKGLLFKMTVLVSSLFSNSLPLSVPSAGSLPHKLHSGKKTTTRWHFSMCLFSFFASVKLRTDALGNLRWAQQTFNS